MDQELLNHLISVRRHLHQNPELSGFEKETSRFLLNEVLKTNPDEVITFKNMGFVARYKGGTSSKIMVRADFDALPIREIGNKSYISKIENISHMCGHDGHATILLGLAHHLKNNKLKGDVFLLFQPAEETGQGAQGVINDVNFKLIQPDFSLALHNLPGYPLHQVISREGTFSAAANSMIIKFHGKTSHAAQPEEGMNPALAMAEITSRFHQLNISDKSNPKFRIVTPIYTEMGEKSYGVSAGYGELHFTLRAWKNDIISAFEKELTETAKSIADLHNIPIDIEWKEKFYSNQNDRKVVEAVKKSASALNLDYLEKETPFKWGEDFGLFTEKFHGAMFGLGSGEGCPALHNPDYDFPDELIETGVNVFYETIDFLQK